ncbi:hypothetical protein BPOR_0131g00170 [Botrytis porri]|uniref:Uncharacterized protein n=1 Tax=Botrytis porri TaxID=87229 RepID=A0A4Z1KWR5_9HELO|nr:hypothetical protein BPOR_0131g00170 [Botrytis porri]
MDASYNLSPEDISDESWQEFVDWDAANPVDMGTEKRAGHSTGSLSIELSEENPRLEQYLLYIQIAS